MDPDRLAQLDRRVQSGFSPALALDQVTIQSIRASYTGWTVVRCVVICHSSNTSPGGGSVPSVCRITVVDSLLQCRCFLAIYGSAFGRAVLIATCISRTRKLLSVFLLIRAVRQSRFYTCPMPHSFVRLLDKRSIACTYVSMQMQIEHVVFTSTAVLRFHLLT